MLRCGRGNPSGLLIALGLLGVLLPGCARPAATAEGPVVLLWIEEVNTHLLGWADPPPRVVEPIRLDRQERTVTLLASSGERSGRGPRALIVYRVYDHDLLLGVETTMVTSAATWRRLRPPDPQVERGVGSAVPSAPVPPKVHRLLPRRLDLRGIGEDGRIELALDDRVVALAAGWTAWFARVAGGAAPFSAVVPSDQAGFSPEDRREIEAVLSAGRPLTVLRLRHLGWWDVRSVPGDPQGDQGGGGR